LAKNISTFLGIVEKGLFKVLASDHPMRGAYRLTSLPINAQQKPVTAEITLSDLEGHAVLLQGVESEEWIWSANVLERGGLIAGAIASEVFDSSGDKPAGMLKYPWVGG
jgi:hypothetical protein